MNNSKKTVVSDEAEELIQRTIELKILRKSKYPSIFWDNVKKLAEMLPNKELAIRLGMRPEHLSRKLAELKASPTGNIPQFLELPMPPAGLNKKPVSRASVKLSYKGMDLNVKVKGESCSINWKELFLALVEARSSTCCQD
jgi:hypothetical protein